MIAIFKTRRSVREKDVKLQVILEIKMYFVVATKINIWFGFTYLMASSRPSGLYRFSSVLNFVKCKHCVAKKYQNFCLTKFKPHFLQSGNFIIKSITKLGTLPS